MVEQMKKRKVSTRVPVTLEFPDEMADAIKEVLEGEYESGYPGENLNIPNHLKRMLPYWA
jgi:hypothetical protein